jgi:hypothetical protein
VTAESSCHPEATDAERRALEAFEDAVIDRLFVLNARHAEEEKRQLPAAAPKKERLPGGTGKYFTAERKSATAERKSATAERKSAAAERKSAAAPRNTSQRREICHRLREICHRGRETGG